MVDMVTGTVVDPLQFTATLTLSTPDHASLLDSLSDAADFTNLLQRIPNDDENKESIAEMIADDLGSSGHNSVHSIEPSISSFNEISSNSNYENSRQHNYLQQQQNSPFSYQLNVNEAHSPAMQQILSGKDPFNNNSSGGLSSTFDLDSTSTMSLPSPGGASCSLTEGSVSPPASVSGRRDSTCSEPFPPPAKNIHQRVSKQIDPMAQLAQLHTFINILDLYLDPLNCSEFRNCGRLFMGSENPRNPVFYYLSLSKIYFHRSLAG